MADQDNAITKIGPLEPVFEKPELVQQNIKKFREACKAILDPKIDMTMISGKQFIRKSGWNVLNQYFGVVTIPIKSWREDLGDGDYMITVVIQTSHKGIIGPARSASCTSMEMREKHGGKSYLGMESHCYGMAETRAVGRASAAWYMVGDPSAEEMEPVNNQSKPQTFDNTPSQKQLDYLKSLGYTGPAPETKQIASNIIEDLKKDESNTVPGVEEGGVDWCKCNEPKPKFEKDSEIKKHVCYECKKPVSAEQASKLLNIEVNY